MGVEQWRVDLHTHTKYSDGADSPLELILHAKAQGLKAVGITDHDNIDGLREGVEQGLAEGIEVIPGVEISTQYKDMKDIHLLGYYFDWTDAYLSTVLHDFQQLRIQRGKQVLEKVNAKLVSEGREEISYQAILARVTGSFGRPHIAEQLIEKGYVKNTDEAFQQYLVPCNVHRPVFSILEAIRLLLGVRGIPVLAHPRLITKDKRQLRKLIKEFQAGGLLGLEAYHNDHDSGDTPYFRKLAREIGLIYTGGSDYHGGKHGNQLGSGRGNLHIPYAVVISLKKCYLATYPFVISLEEVSEKRKKLFTQVLSQFYNVFTVSGNSLQENLRAQPHTCLFDASSLTPAEREQWSEAASQQEKKVVILTENRSAPSSGPTRIFWPADINSDVSYAPHLIIHQMILAR